MFQVYYINGPSKSVTTAQDVYVVCGTLVGNSTLVLSTYVTLSCYLIPSLPITLVLLTFQSIRFSLLIITECVTLHWLV